MKKRKIPLRKCVVSHQQFPKQEMIRIVKTPEGIVEIDTKGKANGRGAYLKLSKENVALARKNRALNKALATDISESIYTELEKMSNEIE
ncbi:MAG: RNase P modulator RnpM [Erysipelotrichaceae bacterium]